MSRHDTTFTFPPVHLLARPTAPDPFNPYPYLAYVWWCETGPSAGQYLNADAQPIFFAGTDPRHPGYPPPEVENDVGTPREQWERVNGPLE